MTEYPDTSGVSEKWLVLAHSSWVHHGGLQVLEGAGHSASVVWRQRERDDAGVQLLPPFYLSVSERGCFYLSQTHLIQITPDSLAEACLQGSPCPVQLTITTNLTCVTPALRADAGEFSVEG